MKTITTLSYQCERCGEKFTTATACMACEAEHKPFAEDTPVLCKMTTIGYAMGHEEKFTSWYRGTVIKSSYMSSLVEFKDGERRWIDNISIKVREPDTAEEV